MAFRVRRGRSARHASAEFASGARHLDALQLTASFHYDAAVTRGDDACTDTACCIESKTSSSHDRIAADASASGGKDADQRSGAGKAAGTASSSQSSPRRGKSPGAHAARHATAHADTGADCRGGADQPVTIRWPYSRWRH